MLFKVKTKVIEGIFIYNDELKIGTQVVVEFNDGIFVGEVLNKVKALEDEKPSRIIRPAKETDIMLAKTNSEKEEHGIKVSKEVAEKYNLPLKIIDGEYSIDSNKFIVVFASEDRVDFRNLVKELAGKLKVRIDLRQISGREEAKKVGGIGICGQECCCKRFGRCAHSNIKMAKCQNLSLAPNKINGQCGKMLCCISYENKHYEEAADKMPKIGQDVKTPDGKGQVAFNDLLKYKVSVKFFNPETKMVSIKEYELEQLKF